MSQVSMDEIRKLVGMQLGSRVVRDQDRFIEDLGAESADIANIVAAAEERFGIAIKEADFACLITVEDLFELTIKRMK